MIPAHSHNLLEAYNTDDGNTFYYNALRSDEADEDTFKVTFTREVSPTGVTVTIVSIVGNNGAQVLESDTTALVTEVNSLQGLPLNGEECTTLGWTYLGNQSSNSENIQAAKVAAANSGYEFKSIYYASGYFVYGCAEQKLFYDQG
jgi:TPP-dependent trihydroxycyclohexane-1,2-dione (THcHDO) dehydratase